MSPNRAPLGEVPPAPPHQQHRMAPPPPLRGPWQWLKSLATPRDKLVLALGVAAALVSGAWTTRVGVAVSLALGAFVTTPVDATAVSTAVRDLQWLACGLFVVETVAWLAFKHVAAQFASAFAVETRRRLKARDEDGDSRLKIAEPGICHMEESVVWRAAPALHAFVRSVALLATAVVLVWRRCEDVVEVGLTVFLQAAFVIQTMLHAPTTVVQNPTDLIDSLFAKYELAEVRAIAAHNAQEMVSVAHGERPRSSGDNDISFRALEVATSAMSIGVAWISVPLVLSLWGHTMTQPTAVPPREAFELTTGVLLAVVALLLLVVSQQRIRQPTDDIDNTTESKAINADTSKGSESGHFTACLRPEEPMTLGSVFQLLKPNCAILLTGVLGAAAAGAMIVWLSSFFAAVAATLVTEFDRCVTVETSVTEPQQECRDVLNTVISSRLTRFYSSTAIVTVCSFLSFFSFRLLGAKVYRRVLSLHVDAICRQSVRRFEALGNGVDAFCAARESLPSDASSMCRRPAIVLVATSTTLCALVAFLMSSTGAIIGPILLLVMIDQLIGWATYKPRRIARSIVDTHTPYGPTVGLRAFVKTMIPVVALSYGNKHLQLGLVPAFADVVAPLVAISLALAAAEMVISQTDVFLEDWKRTVNACQVIIELRALMVKSTHNQKTQRTKPLGTIQFQNVCFQDPVKKNISPLKQLSLTINAGETVVFCGPSGAGHEHVVTLLERFYDPASGDVLMDDENLKDVDTVWLREQIGLLSTDPILFEGSVSDNISVGCGRVATQEEIEVAAKIAQAHDYIVENLVDGYASKVTPAETYSDHFGFKTRHTWTDHRLMSVRMKDGSAASMDVHHSIAFARVWLKDPSVLVLNEPTKEVPSKNLKVVRQGIDKLRAVKKRTTIIIGLDPPAVGSSDRIYVFSDGEIAEQGTHDQLVAKEGGLYRSLVE